MKRAIRNILAGMPLLYMAAIMPRMRKKPDSSWFSEYHYAHRGLYDNKAGIPEDSLPAFERAAAAGYGIELDVQLTKDKVPVVFHDFTLNRICGISGKVSEYRYEELKNFRLCDTGASIPTLAEVLEQIDGRVPLIVELKIEWADPAVCKATDQLLTEYKGAYCIECFSPVGLLWYRAFRPEVIRGQLAMDFRRHGGDGDQTVIHRALTYLLFNFLTKPDFIAYDYKAADNLSFRICRKLYKCLAVAFTVTSLEDMDGYADCYDSFIFEGFEP